MRKYLALMTLLSLSACQGLEPAWALPEHRREAARLESLHQLPTGLLSGICEVESNWIHPTNKGAAGEIGLCQLKPSTARSVCPECETKVGNLHQGVRSKEVRELQIKLVKLGYTPGRPDGVFGLRTHIAVTLFQSSRGLKPDGIVGPRTWRALGVNKSSIEEILKDPYKNLELAARYLVQLRAEKGTNDPDILAALYNGGPKSKAAEYMLKVRRANE